MQKTFQNCFWYIFILFGIFLVQKKALADGLNISGYAQVDYISSTHPSEKYGFQVKNFNAIWDASPSPRARILGDIEFEEGADHTPDSTKGTIKLSRLFIDYQFHKFLIARLGKFLTPIGLYNEIHDFSITFNTVDVPRFYGTHTLRTGPGVISAMLFPKYSTGLNLLGTIPLHTKERSIFEYMLYTANGRDELQEGTDANKSACLGTRLIYKFGPQQKWQTGFSAIGEKVITGIDQVPDSQQNTYGYFLQFDNGHFLGQFETFLFEYDKASTKKKSTIADSFIHFAYFLNNNITPFIHFEWEQTDMNSGKLLTDLRFGAATAITPTLYFKLEFDDVQNDPAGKSKLNYQTYRASASMAF